MTKQEINELLNIPTTTQNDWAKPGGPREKLYDLLVALDKEDVKKLLSAKKRKIHRLSHILNRNIDSAFHYSAKEIRDAFSLDDYSRATSRQKTVIDKFFKECEPDDLESLCAIYKVSKRKIKQIYKSSKERHIQGVARVWNGRFRLTQEHAPAHKARKPSPALQAILSKKASDAV